MKDKIISSVGRIFHKVCFGLKKHSPEILIAAGVAGTIVSTVLACKATTKINSVLENAKHDIDTIHECSNDDEYADRYTPEDSKKDLAIVYIQTGLKVVKLYTPAFIVGTLSIAGIITSNTILRKRNAALVAAYSIVDKSFKEYRGRVAERFGEEIDRELRYNIKAKKISETVVDDDGKEIEIEKEIKVSYVDGISDYARFFDESCAAWEKNSEYNLYFLKAQQRYANDILVSRGYLFLNEVYDMLGIPKTKAGQIVGWVYDKDNPIGDNCVDFGIYDINKEKTRDFVNGYERSILLDFNVDGDILDRI